MSRRTLPLVFAALLTPWWAAPIPAGERALAVAAAGAQDVSTPAPVERCVDAPAGAVVTFSDPDLESAVKDALSIPRTAPLTCRLAATVTNLPRIGAIESLDGIQNLTALTSVDFGYNGIRDLTPLASLTQLEAVNLTSNPALADLTPLSGLGELRVLSLSRNRISDLSPLSALTGLTTLYLDENAIVDLTPLRPLGGLRVLYLSENPDLVDLGPLASLTNLRVLHLARNPGLSDLSPLGRLSNLTALDLDGSAITDLGPLGGLGELRVLYLANNPQLMDLGGLAPLVGLRVLHVSGNPNLVDVGPLSALPELTVLDLSNDANLNDIQPLLDNSGLGGGDEVYLEGTPVSCVSVQALRAKRVFVPLSVQATCR